MSWQDRVQGGFYTGPVSGITMGFEFEDVSISFDKKVTAFEFSDADGTFVQDRGKTGRRVPLRIFLSGDDYDQAAKAFIDLLGETGIGILDHPMYGTLDVIPFGKITRADRLKTQGNQTIIEVTFFETNGLLFPIAGVSPGDAVEQTVDDFNEAGSEELAAEIDTDTEIEKSSFKDKALAEVDRIRSGLRIVSNITDAVERAVQQVFTSINSGIDLLIADPLTLALQMQQLTQIPARSTALIADRLDAYGNLLTSIIGVDGEGTPGVPTNDSQAQNTFHTQDLSAANSIIGAIVSVLDATFVSRSDALEAADLILSFCADYVVWKDANLVALSIIDSGLSYQQLQEACALAAGFLVEISFTLKQERTIITDRPRTVIDLEGELYQTAGENLDRLITDNGLVVSQILEVPEGTTIRFYV